MDSLFIVIKYVQKCDKYQLYRRALNYYTKIVLI